MARSEPGPAGGLPPWFEILKRARDLSPDDAHRFTAANLAEACGLVDTSKSSGSQIASAWLSKFVKWGYAWFVAKVEGAGIRPSNAYVLTEKGRTCVPTEGRVAKLARLLAAVRRLEDARGTKAEAQAFRDLLKTANEIEETS